MSDGNFNRSMLPSNSYQSGLRAGRAQMKTLALQAFKSWLRQQEPNADDFSISQQIADFKSRIE